MLNPLGGSDAVTGATTFFGRLGSVEWCLRCKLPTYISVRVFMCICRYSLIISIIRFENATASVHKDIYKVRCDKHDKYAMS